MKKIKNILVKILNVRNLFMIAIICINLFAVVYCINQYNSSSKKLSTLPKYEDISSESENLDDINETYNIYTVKQQTVSIYRLYDGELTTTSDEPFLRYRLDSVNENVVKNTIFNKDSLIGKISDSDVKIPNKAVVVSVDKNELNSYDVVLLKQDIFVCSAYVPQYDYYTYDFSKENDFKFVLSDNTQIDLEYKDVDFEYGLADGKVKIDFSVKNDSNTIIMPGVTGSVFDYYKTIENAYLIPRKALPSMHVSKEVQLRTEASDGSISYKNIYISSSYEYLSYYVITGKQLKDGLQIYERNN